MAVNVNCAAFFEKYRSDSQLRERLAELETMYPGSLENREAVAEEVLLPVAEELGLPFTVRDLFEYENLCFVRERAEESDDVPEERTYWLINHGWNSDESRFCGE